MVVHLGSDCRAGCSFLTSLVTDKTRRHLSHVVLYVFGYFTAILDCVLTKHIDASNESFILSFF
jgi:hypothetical protein